MLLSAPIHLHTIEGTFFNISSTSYTNLAELTQRFRQHSDRIREKNKIKSAGKKYCHLSLPVCDYQRRADSAVPQRDERTDRGRIGRKRVRVEGGIKRDEVRDDLERSERGSPEDECERSISQAGG